jgi:hypothetical protein
MIRVTLALLALAGPAAAQDADHFRFGNDVFYGGASPTIEGDGIDDAFAAGERVELAVPIAGTAHLAGRRADARADIGGNLYAAGADVTVAAPVAGDATLAGYDVSVGGAIGDDLRAAGRTVEVTAPVGGTALLTAETVALDARIAGDAAIAADTLEFGPGAAVGGRLALYGPEAENLAVPDTVAPPDRIDRHPSEHARAPEDDRRPGWATFGIGFLVGVVILALLATLAAAVAPASVERLRDLTGDRPFRTLWIGFLTLSTLIGAAVLATLSVIGIVAVPVILLIAAVLGFVGYIIAVYLVGRAIWNWIGQLPPDSLPERALAALLGAVAVTLLGLIPFAGWLVLLILTLTGIGALSVAMFRPEFRS